jgi:hypothetical protein
MKGIGAMKPAPAGGVGKMKQMSFGVGKMRGEDAEGDKKKSMAAAADLAKLFEKKK